jgi:hypothetical protein
MMKCIVTYYECCKKVLLESQKMEKKISMSIIEENFKTSIIAELTEMKMILPTVPEHEMKQKLDAFAEQIQNEFNKLLHG